MAETNLPDHLRRTPSVFDGFVGPDGNPIQDVQPQFAQPLPQAVHPVYQAPLEGLAQIAYLRFGALQRKLAQMDPTDPRRGPVVQILRDLEIYARDRQIILPEDDPVEYLISLIDGDGSNSEDRLEAQEEFGNDLHHASAEDIEVINDRITSILMQLRGVRHIPEMVQPENKSNCSYLSVAIPVAAGIAALAIQYFFTL